MNLKITTRKGRILVGILTGMVLSGSLVSTSQATIQIDGLEDRQVFSGETRFRIPPTAGYRHEALLNGEPVPPRLWIPVRTAGYYELKVTRRPIGDKETVSEHKTVRFVIEDPRRGASERGLRPWTPPPLIDSPPLTSDPRTFRFLLPSQWPQGVRIPIIVFANSSDDKVSLGRNTRIRWAGYPDRAIRVKRGYGHGFLPPPSQPGEMTLRPSEGSELKVRVEEDTEWREIEEVNQSKVEWGPDARIKIPKDLTVSAGTTLTIREGSLILLAPGVDIRVLGHLTVEGTRSEPVVWMPSRAGEPWGGLILPEAGAELEVNGAILTGSGADPDWFVDQGIANTHRKEQAMAFLGPGSVARFTDSYLVDHSGQAFHGDAANLELNRCLIQACQTTGQFNGGSVTANESAFIDFPNDSSRYVDGDNDAIYLTKGDHAFHDSLIGWCKDDGIDAGGSTDGTLKVDGCWFEACFHEGMALSGSQKQVQVTDSVFLSSGQGVEAGYLSPQVDVRQSLFIENQVGARFGDNYDWGYGGTLQVHDSVLLFNQRDVWGMVFDEWRQKFSHMEIEDNLLTSNVTQFPNNRVAAGSTPQARLDAFPRPSGRVGVGFTAASSEAVAGDPRSQITVGLSRFSSSEVTVDVSVTEGPDTIGATPMVSPSTVRFSPGEMYKELIVRFREPARIDGADSFSLTLKDAAGASTIAHQSQHTVEISEPRAGRPLSSKEGDWRFRKGTREASQPATAWRTRDYDDSEWARGAAPFGYGDGRYGTRLSEMRGDYTSVFLRKTFTVDSPLDLHWLQFRFEYDDGVILWLNGEEVLRRRVPGEAGDFLPFDATANRAKPDATTEVVSFSVDQLPPLRRGENQLAVHVFNHRLYSSDLMFDLALFNKDLGDKDADGLPDGWEYRIRSRETDGRFEPFGDIEPTVDTDGDGMRTWQEYFARTDPTDAASVLRLEWTDRANGGRSLHLRTRPHMKYRIERRDSISATSTWNPFLDVAARPTAESVFIETPMTTEIQRRFYRARPLIHDSEATQ